MYKLNEYVIPKVPKQLLTSQNRPQVDHGQNDKMYMHQI